MGRIAGLAVAAVAALSTACLVEVSHVSDPRPAFAHARSEAARVQGRSGPAQELNVLVYDPHDREMVSVSLPMWLVRKLENEGRMHSDSKDSGEDKVDEVLKRHITMKELERAGLGVLVEVEEEDGEQVLVWLR